MLPLFSDVVERSLGAPQSEIVGTFLQDCLLFAFSQGCLLACLLTYLFIIFRWITLLCFALLCFAFLVLLLVFACLFASFHSRSLMKRRKKRFFPWRTSPSKDAVSLSFSSCGFPFTLSWSRLGSGQDPQPSSPSAEQG